MNQNFSRLAQINLSGVGCWLTFFAVVILLSSLGLGWVLNWLFILITLPFFLLLVAFFVLRWWVSRNVVEDECPVCRYSFTAFNGLDINCPNCGEPLKVEKGQFLRVTPPGTIDVEAIEVDVKKIE